MCATSGTRNTPPPPPHPQQPTAILRQPLMEEPWMYPWRITSWASLFSLPPVSHPHLRRRTTVINIHLGDAVCRSCSLDSPSTKSPLANGVHPWHLPWRDPAEGTRSLKDATGWGPDLSCHISIYRTRVVGVFFLFVFVFLVNPLSLLQSQPKPTLPLQVALHCFRWTKTAFEGWMGCSRCVSSTSQLPNWHLGFGPCWDQDLFFLSTCSSQAPLNLSTLHFT